MIKKTVYLSLGSNLGDLNENLKTAVNALQRKDIVVLKRSSIYQTKPVGLKTQPDFYNMVIKAETSYSPEGLLKKINHIEKELGRTREIKWGPRKIDIDILLYNDVNLHTDKLIIPHPQMHKRNFVLIPLIEIEPELIHPVLKKKFASFITDSKGNVRKL